MGDRNLRSLLFLVLFHFVSDEFVFVPLISRLWEEDPRVLWIGVFLNQSAAVRSGPC